MRAEQLKSITRTLFKTVLPLVGGLGMLGLVIAWLSGAFATRIEPGRADIPQRSLERGQSTDVVHEVTKDYMEEAVGTLKAAGRAAFARTRAFVVSTSFTQKPTFWRTRLQV